MEPTQKKILCVDDDADDRLFLLEAITAIDPQAAVVEVENGLAAMDYLYHSKLDGEPLPSLIILDMNMPLLDGKQTFQKIKEDPVLQSIPIVIFTNSANPNDKTHFNEYGVDLFTKPDNFAYIYDVASTMLAHC